MKVLVIGGTGTVGKQVVRDLQAAGVEIALVTRDEAKAQSMHPNVHVLKGSTLDQAFVRGVFKGYDAVFMLNPSSQTETHEGLMAVNGARLCGVRRFVYMSVQEADSAQYLPHFGAKVPIENVVKTSGMEWTILRPNNFHQNEQWFKSAILDYGVYPQPLGDVGLHRVDVRDISAVAVIALTTGRLNGQMLDLVGPEVWTGPATAELWTRLLGKPIRYIGHDMDAWEVMFRQWVPDWLVFDWRMMYEYFQEHGLKGTPQDIERLTKILGRPLIRFEDYAKETAKAWTSQ